MHCRPVEHCPSIVHEVTQYLSRSFQRARSEPTPPAQVLPVPQFDCPLDVQGKVQKPWVKSDGGKPGVAFVCVSQMAVEPRLGVHCEAVVHGEPTPLVGAPPPLPPPVANPPPLPPPPAALPPPTADAVQTPLVQAVKPLRTQF